MQNLGRKIELFVIVVIIAVIGIVYAFKQKPARTTEVVQSGGPALAPTSNSQLEQNQVIEYEGVDGKNALELLKASHSVEAKHYDFGDLVTGIDGITPGANHFWAMYVNGQFSQVGASAYVTKSTDTIKWQVDEVSSQ